MSQGKGPGYERWAKVYNIKQMAAALQFLQENGLTDYDELAAKTDAAVDRAHALAEHVADLRAKGQLPPPRKRRRKRKAGASNQK